MLLNQQSFSLIELMIVIALLTLIATLGIGPYKTYHRFLVTAELNQLRLLFLCVRYKAMALHTSLSITFNSIQQTYTIDNQVHHLQMAQLHYLPDTMGPPANPVQLIRNSISFANDSINFYEDGSISAGTLYVTDKQHSCMYALTIAVNDFFNIRIYSYNKTWHLIA